MASGVIADAVVAPTIEGNSLIADEALEAAVLIDDAVVEAADAICEGKCEADAAEAADAFSSGVVGMIVVVRPNE
jgi:hypothetical protein